MVAHRHAVAITAALLALVHCSGSAIVEPSSSGSDASGSGSSGGSSSGSNGGSSGVGGSSSGTGGSSGGSSSSGGGSSGGSSSSGGDAACPQAADAGPRATTPPAHRAQATACSHSANNCASTDGGGQPCSTDADCTPDGSLGTAYRYCSHGQCAIDQCLADSDCPATQVCSCSSAYYGGNGCIHPNLCVPANCHVDADCGPGSFCSPTAGYCGVVGGFYCHKASDACFDPAVDCACLGPPNNACVYAPTVGSWTCGSTLCAG